MQEYENESGQYRTGAMQPQKSHGALIAFLLVCVIFSGGIASFLGLMNIRLFARIEQLESSAQAPVSFSMHTRQSSAQAPAHTARLGIACCDVSDFWQHYRDLPAGVYVTAVAGSSAAAQSGIEAGDILLSFDGSRITDVDSLAALLKQAGKTADIQLQRKSEILQISVRFEQE